MSVMQCCLKRFGATCSKLLKLYSKVLKEFCEMAMLYVDCSLVLQLHIEDGRILNSNEQINL